MIARGPPQPVCDAQSNAHGRSFWSRDKRAWALVLEVELLVPLARRRISRSDRNMRARIQRTGSLTTSSTTRAPQAHRPRVARQALAPRRPAAAHPCTPPRVEIPRVCGIDGFVAWTSLFTPSPDTSADRLPVRITAPAWLFTIYAAPASAASCHEIAPREHRHASAPPRLHAPARHEADRVLAPSR